LLLDTNPHLQGLLSCTYWILLFNGWHLPQKKDKHEIELRAAKRSKLKEMLNRLLPLLNKRCEPALHRAQGWTKVKSKSLPLCIIENLPHLSSANAGGPLIMKLSSQSNTTLVMRGLPCTWRTKTIYQINFDKIWV
jgi:hypothetical protein